ncbi:hypothetical protein NOR_02777 [Metarhizium rileyi]|nr:hypothetical protein NOR_02777 [Metarhizium rileyi RCEF 4871]
MAENHASWLITAMAVFLPWSLLTFCVRVWAKLASKNWGRDDYYVSFAMASAVAQVAVTCHAIQHELGLPRVDIRETDLQRVQIALYIGQILYVLSIGLCRVSAAFFIARMTYLGPQSKPAYIVASSSVLWTVVSMLVIALRGQLERPWEVPEHNRRLHLRWIVVEAIGIVIELSLWALSVHLVWSLQMRRKKRAFIICAFGARLGIIPIIVCRVVYLAPTEDPGRELIDIVPSVLTQGAIHFSLMAGCITCLKPFLRTFNTSYTVQSKDAAMGDASGGRGSIYYKLETLQRVERSAADSDDSANWRPFQGSGQGPVVSCPAEPHFATNDKLAQRLDDSSRRVSKGPSSELGEIAKIANADGSHRLIIQRTTEFSVYSEGGVAD